MKEKFMKLYESNKKAFFLGVIAIVAVLTLVIGSTFAFFMAAGGTSDETDVTITTHTVDSLSLSVGDPITIEADQDNFGDNAGNRPGSTTATAILRPNNKTNEASATYNLFFVIEDNDLVYTTEAQTPELVLKVKTPDGETYLQNITGLVGDNGTFDITTRQGSFAIVTDYPINATNGQTASQTWEVEVILVNLESDQDRNTGKTVTGKLVITQEQIATYQPARVNSLSTTGADLGVTYNSISLSLNTTTGTELIDKYYYGIEEAEDEVTAFIPGSDIALKRLSSADVTYVESESPTHTFDNLEQDTEYTIYSYVVDRKGIKSNTYSTNIKTTEYDYPEVTTIETTSTLYSIRVAASATAGANPIAAYAFSIDNGETWTDYQENNSYTFTGLNHSSSYDVKVKVRDSIGMTSPEYYRSVDTEVYQKATINNIGTTKTHDSMTATVSATAGSYSISKYYFCIVAECGNNDWIESDTNSYTFTELTAETSYTISVKIKDSNNVYSNVSTATDTTGAYVLPSVTNVSTNVSTTSVTITATVDNGSAEALAYYYSVNGGSSFEYSNSNEYTFSGLTPNSTLYIQVYVVDSNDETRVSNTYETTATLTPVTLTLNSVTDGNIEENSASFTINKTDQYGYASKILYRFSGDELWIEGGNPQYGNNFEIQNLTSGTEYTIEVKITDYYGDISSNVVEKTFTTAYRNPSLTSVSSMSQTWNSITASVSYESGSSNVVKYYFKTETTDWVESSTDSYTFNNLLPDQQYTIYAKVKDERGIYSNVESTTANTSSYNYPTASISNLTPSYTSVTFTISSTDGDGTVDTYMYSLDSGNTWTTCASSNCTINNLNSNYDYYLDVKVVDDNGYESQQNSSESFRTLYINPTITGVTTTKTYNSVTLTVSATDGSEEISQYCFEETAPVASGSNCISSNEYTFDNLEESTQYTFRVSVSPSGMDSVYEDVTVTTNAYGLPTITSTNHSETYNSITITANATGGDGTISKYAFAIDGGTAVEYTTSNASQAHTFNVAEGSTPHSVVVTVTDSNGRSSSSTISNLVTPAYVPATVTSVTKIATTAHSITVNVAATEGQNTLAGFKFSTDGTNYGSLQASTTSPFSYEVTGLDDNTNYTVYVVAVDSIGRESAAGTVSATTDYIEPTVTLAVSNVSWGSVTLTATATAGSTSIVGYEYQVGSQGWTSSQASNIYNGYNELDPDTPYVFSVRVTDSAGHTATATANATTLTYTYASVTAVGDSSTFDSITLTATASAGTGTISKYFFKLGSGSWVEETGNSHTFGSLDPNTQYSFVVKVLDSNGKYSQEFNKTASTSRLTAANVNYTNSACPSCQTVEDALDDLYTKF